MNVTARLDHASPAAGVVAGVAAASVACAARIGAAAWTGSGWKIPIKIIKNGDLILGKSDDS